MKNERKEMKMNNVERFEKSPVWDETITPEISQDIIFHIHRLSLEIFQE